MPFPFFRKVTKSAVVTTNFMIGLLFLGGAFVRLFNPDHYWYLSLLAILLPLLIFLLLAFIIFWILFRSRWSLLSIGFLLIGWNAVINILPPRLPYKFHVGKKEGEIRVMSWNVEQFNIQNYKRFPERKALMLDLINKYDPDIACLQEVVAGENPKAINYLPDLIKQLHFKDYFFAYKLGDDFDRYHHFGTMILSKYPIVRKQLVVNNPDSYNSSFQFIDVLIGKDTIRIFNVHLQSLKFSKENRNYLDNGRIGTSATHESESVIRRIKLGVQKRALQAAYLKDEMNHTPYSKILCGDFNDVPVSYAYELLGKNMQNAFVKKGFGLSRTFSEISPTLRIDNIFADSSFQIDQYTRVKKLLSDHYPILADMKLNK